jgi:probable rRNA maturation factor
MSASPNVSSSSSSNEPPPAHARKSSVSRPALDAFVRRAKTRIGLTGQVNILLADDATLRNLNREYRGKDKATDVLSFPGLQIEGMPESSSGDLAVSLDTAARQAAEHGHSLQTEVKILLLHGLLHLAGFNHETDAGEMRQREAELRARFRLPVGLITRSER